MSDHSDEPPSAPASADLPTSLLTGELVDPAAEVAAPEPPRSNKGVRLLSAAVVVVVLGAVIGIVVAATSSSRATSQQIVSAALQATISRHSAEVVISGQATGPSGTTPISGRGEMVFGNGGGFVGSLTEEVGGHTLRLDETAIAHETYMSISVGGTNEIGAFDPGKRWVELPTTPSQLSQGLGGSVDPLAELQLLAKKGYSVRRIGTGTVDGVAVTSYRVTISKAEMQRNLAAAMKSQPAYVRPLMAVAAKGLGTMSFTISIDGSNLLRRIATVTTIGSGHAQVFMTYEDYGVSASLHAPRRSSVLAFAQFVQLQQRAAGNSSGA